MRALAGLAAIGAALAFRAARGGDFAGLGLFPSQNQLCFFEVFEGQEGQSRTPVVFGSPIECFKLKSASGISKVTDRLRKLEGRKGDPKVVCEFPLRKLRKGIGFGKARKCRKVKG